MKRKLLIIIGISLFVAGLYGYSIYHVPEGISTKGNGMDDLNSIIALATAMTGLMTSIINIYLLISRKSKEG